MGLKQADCEVATMESTGSYWKPVWNVLEGQIPSLVLANAQHVRALPGEKTDRKDGKRLAELTRHGQIRPSYVPPRAIRELRDLTRYRSKLLSAGSSERESNSEGIGRRQYQARFGFIRYVWRIRAKDAASVGQARHAGHRRDRQAGTLETQAEDGGD